MNASYHADMLDRLRIIVPGFPESETDTTCLPAVQNYIRALARLHPDADIRVIALHYPFDSGYYTWHGLRVFAAGGSNAGGLRKLRTWRRAWRAITDGSAGLIHSFWIGECALLGAIAARRLRCAHVASIGGRELLEPTPYTPLLRKAGFLLVAGSSHAAETSLRTLRRPVDAIIPLGLDIAQFPPTDRDRTIDVLFVGSLIAVKCPQDVLRVARRLPNARFVIVGDGPERSALAASSPPNVELAGHVQRSNVINLMQQSKVLLHPAHYESQGYVFLEALASGMHVVCRDVGAPGDSVKVHRRDTIDEMTQTVSKLLLHEDGYQPVPVPTADDSVRAYTEVYRQAIAGEKPRPSPRSAARASAEPTSGVVHDRTRRASRSERSNPPSPSSP